VTAVARASDPALLATEPLPVQRATRPLAERIAYYVPLILILAGQAALTLALARWAYASGDEGRYIYSGHQLIHELLHGGGSPFYETYFSGAPVIYPVLAALADHVGGLIAVRLMSLVFAATATCLLFAVCRRWFGYWPAVLASGLFAGLGLTQDLGALATYDAMALMLLAVAGYCAARTGGHELHATRWLVAVPVALLAANATKYATILFDPVVIGVAACQVSRWTARRAAVRLAALALTTGMLLVVALFLGGSGYLQGIMSSTLSRNSATAAFAGQLASTDTIIRLSWDWIGAVVAIGGLAVLLAIGSRQGRRKVCLLGVLLLAGLLVTAEAIHLGSFQSMYKHDDFGAWFTAAAAGYPISLLRKRVLQATVAVLLVAGSGFAYTRTAISTYQADDGVTALRQFAALKPYLEIPGGRFLLGGLSDEQMIYVDGVSVPWFRLIEDTYIKYPVPGRGGDWHGQAQGPVCLKARPGCMYLEGPAGFEAAIRAHDFAMISMLGQHGSAWDAAIQATASRTPGYERLLSFSGPPTWVYAPDYPALDAPLGAR
jgi:hypothetical protein